jgi:hypothetical protein
MGSGKVPHTSHDQFQSDIRLDVLTRPNIKGRGAFIKLSPMIRRTESCGQATLHDSPYNQI